MDIFKSFFSHQVCANINGALVQLEAGADRSKSSSPMSLGVVFDVEIPGSAQDMTECTIDLSQGCKEILGDVLTSRELIFLWWKRRCGGHQEAPSSSPTAVESDCTTCSDTCHKWWGDGIELCLNHHTICVPEAYVEEKCAKGASCGPCSGGGGADNDNNDDNDDDNDDDDHC